MNQLMRFYYDPEGAAGGGAPVVVEEPPVSAAAAPADLKPGSASATVDINAKPPVEPSAFVLPDAYKDKPYLKTVKGLDDVYKMLDGAQELIGKKGPVVPKADAPQAEKDAYYESIGRPKTAAEYTPVLTGADKTDPKVLPRLQGAFHKAGLTPDQAKIVWDESNAAFSDFAKEKGLAETEIEVDFTKLATDTFGVDKDRVITRGNELIRANLSPSMNEALKKLDNNALIVLSDVLRNIDKKYIKQDGPGGQPVATGSTPDELRSKARGLMAEQSKHDSMSQQFIALQKQIDECYNTMRRGTR